MSITCASVAQTQPFSAHLWPYILHDAHELMTKHIMLGHAWHGVHIKVEVRPANCTGSHLNDSVTLQSHGTRISSKSYSDDIKPGERQIKDQTDTPGRGDLSSSIWYMHTGFPSLDVERTECRCLHYQQAACRIDCESREVASKKREREKYPVAQPPYGSKDYVMQPSCWVASSWLHRIQTTSKGSAYIIL